MNSKKKSFLHVSGVPDLRKHSPSDINQLGFTLVRSALQWERELARGMAEQLFMLFH